MPKRVNLHLAVIWAAALLALVSPHLRAGEVGRQFDTRIKPVLEKYCSDCHMDGASKGNVTLDEFASEEALTKDPSLWLRVLKNVRANLMPPAKKPQPSSQDRQALAEWIKYQAFAIDPNDPDPGRVTLRRLNRIEYANTIRDLMGVEFKAEEEFPPDDTGYGFDTVADALSVSPLLLEKYMQAAEQIVAKAVPARSRTMGEAVVTGASFRSVGEKDEGEKSGGGGGGKGKGGRGEGKPLSFYDPATLVASHKVAQAGKYHLALEILVRGDFDFDPGRVKVVFKVDDRELARPEYGWENGQRFTLEFDEAWEPGERKFSFEVIPLVPKEKKTKNALDVRIVSLKVRGPTEPEKWERPKNFERFFTKDAPEGAGERRAYAREVLAAFAAKAFRRPVDEKIVDRLVKIAEAGWTSPDKTFQQGVGQAMIAVLASPRFLFRAEGTVAEGQGGGGHPLIDEYALASRLSYFLWSTMPDEELMRLAGAGELRKNLAAQVKRMLADSRSEALVENFIGQWLQVRDVDGISIDGRVVLARDSGTDKELQEIFAKFQALRAKREEETRKQIAAGQKVQDVQRGPEEEKLRERFRELRKQPLAELDGQLRTAMRRETEMTFDYVIRQDRSVLDLLDSNYTFLNERLAKHYGIKDVKGEQMRRVELPPDSPRGGVLTQGSVLVVTSNPTRTSPVKRGLFVLDNVIGAPPPPPPADIPALEASEKSFENGKEPSLREVLELHRSKPLCMSCHDRMDPLGLALENFNAMGMWRETERKVPIDPKGRLITGEPFDNVKQLKRILVTQRRADFYRCLTEKLMTYALGRGLEYYDVEAVDRIVDRMEREGGRFSALLNGVVESVPFQKRRKS